MSRESYGRKVSRRAKARMPANVRAIETRDGRVCAGTDDGHPRTVWVFRDADHTEMIVISGEDVRVDVHGKSHVIHRWGDTPAAYNPH